MAMFVPQPAQTMALATMAPTMQPAPELPPGATITGKVKAWMEDKGFGFITPDNGGPDVFVHRNQLSDGQSLTAGAAVVFECRLNVARGKYEATTCSGAAGTPSAVVPAPLDISGAKGLLGGKGGMRGSQDNLFVAGLPLDSTEEQIRDMFGQYGIVSQCKVLPDTPGKMDRAALVRFGDETQAKWMVDNLNGKVLQGLVQPLTVRFAGDRGGFFGKAMGKGDAIVDNRFSPYGAVSPAVAQVAQAAAAANPNLSDATLAAALIQLLPGMQQNAQPGMQQAPALGNVAGMQVGLTAPDAGQLAAGQQVGIQQLGGQPMIQQQQQQLQLQQQQQLPGQPLVGQAVGVQQLQALPGQTAPGQAFAVQAPAGVPAVAVQPAAAMQQLGGQTAPEAAAAAAMPGAAVSPVAAGQLQTLGSQQPSADPAVAAAAPGVAAPAPALAAAPGGQWLEAADPASGRPYYYHSVTREVRWEKPAE